jgi:hypothetical protein
LKNGDWLRTESLSREDNARREVPVALFQQTARESQRQ